MIKERQSNIELLRIISMLAILGHHYIWHGLIPIELGGNMALHINHLFAHFLYIGGNFGVNCFIVISSYFLLDSTFNGKRIVQILFQTTFYSVLFLSIYYFCGNEISWSDIFQNFFPILFSKYWFITTYIMFYIIVILINPGVNKLSTKSLVALSTLLLLMNSSVILNKFCPEIFFYSNLKWFLMIYFFVAIIKRYESLKIFKWNHYFIVSSILYFLAFLSIMFIDFLAINNNYYVDKELIFFNSKGIVMLVISLVSFLAFKNLNINNHKLINTLSASTTGVYLIHDNHPYFSDWLWFIVIKQWSIFSYDFFVIFSIIIIIIIYFLISFVDFVYKNTIEKYILNYAYKFIAKKWKVFKQC